MIPAKIPNGTAIPLSEVPVFPFVAFQDHLLRACGDGARLVCLCADADLQGYAVLASEEGPVLQVLRTAFPGMDYPSLTPRCPQAHLFEREMAEQRGLKPLGHPWFKPVRCHAPWGGAPDPWKRKDGIPPGVIPFYRVEGHAVHEVGVGPVHAGVIEPGHFRFQCNGETVFSLEIALGYQHRGIERALLGGPDRRTLKFMETAAGDTTIGHAWTHALVMEGLLDLEVPLRANLLRGVALELERLANHTGDLGAIAGDTGFLPTQSYCGRLRGDWLNQTAHLCGSRLGRDLVRPGGVRFDASPERVAQLRERLEATYRDTRDAVDLMWATASVLARMEGTGRVVRAHAENLGMVGPAARACGIPRDARKNHPVGPYLEAAFEPALDEMGDVAARARVRWQEVKASVDFLRWALDVLQTLPPGPIQAEVPRFLPPDHLAVGITEGWRGEIAHLAVTDTDGRFGLYKIVDPSFRNWPGLALALRGEDISDFPLCNKSFNLSYCGFDL